MSFFGHESAIARQRRAKRAAGTSAAAPGAEMMKERSIESGSGEKEGGAQGVEELPK